MSEGDGHLSEKTRLWVQGIADRDYGGNWGAAAAGLLEALHAAEQEPGNRWAYLEERMRRGPQTRPPT